MVAELKKKDYCGTIQNWRVSPSLHHRAWTNSKRHRLVVINSVYRNDVEHHASHNMLTIAGLRCAHILTRPAARDGNLDSPSTELGHHDDPGHRPDFLSQSCDVTT